jgi:DNA-binding MarR family transcriptional regulator
MPAGRPIFSPCPNTYRILMVLADGKAYSRYRLRQRTGMPHASVSPAIQRLYRRGWLDRWLNPVFNQSRPNDVWRETGQAACRYVYSLNDEGLKAVKRETAARVRLLTA